MTRTSVLLPVTQATYDEIADEVAARGQADRIQTRRKMIDLSDVTLIVQPEKKLAPVAREGKRT